MAGASSALCQAGQHPAVTEKGPYVTYNHNRGSFVAILIGLRDCYGNGLRRPATRFRQSDVFTPTKGCLSQLHSCRISSALRADAE